MESIILIGMPFCGKSSVGKIISETLKCKFVDTDEIIEQREKLSIVKIFDIKGEEYFRKAECSLVDDLKGKESLIIATGGGLPIYNNNMDKLNDMGVTFFINTPLEQLKNRSIDNDDRPLLKEGDFSKLEKMFDFRMSIYKSAHFTINAQDMPLDEIATIILNKFYLH